MNDTTMMSGQKVKRSKVKEIIVVYGSSEHSVWQRILLYAPQVHLYLELKGPFIATQLNSTRRRVELSCVAINGPLVASTSTKSDTGVESWFLDWSGCVCPPARSQSVVDSMPSWCDSSVILPNRTKNITSPTSLAKVNVANSSVE